MENNQEILYFITGNKNKFSEVLNLFEKETLNKRLRQKDVKTYEIQAESLKDVAKFKLNSVKEKIDSSFFIEDAGFFIDFPLNGFPGVYSSYVLRTIGNEGIIKLIDNFNLSRAHFSAIIALYFKPLDKIFYFEGNVMGKISHKIRGTGGFGFDPIFIPDCIPDKTFAELSIEEKNRTSHRGKALKKLINFLKEN
ncbi:MAG: RdgB/HAM1 family non-canonical purine NTP pyrophosphatase [Promethearchaeota archaeon]